MRADRRTRLVQRPDLGEAHKPALVHAILEADMDDHAEGQEFRKTRAVSKLDWPTPEMLAAAHRLRAKALKEMAAEFGRWLKVLIDEHVLIARLGRSRLRPAKVRTPRRR
jgi:hypothetical protein